MFSCFPMEMWQCHEKDTSDQSWFSVSIRSFWKHEFVLDNGKTATNEAKYRKIILHKNKLVYFLYNFRICIDYIPVLPYTFWMFRRARAESGSFNMLCNRCSFARKMLYLRIFFI